MEPWNSPRLRWVVSVWVVRRVLADSTDTTPEEIARKADLEIAPQEEAEIVGYGESVS